MLLQHVASAQTTLFRDVDADTSHYLVENRGSDPDSILRNPLMIDAMIHGYLVDHYDMWPQDTDMDEYIVRRRRPCPRWLMK